jgi:hypothetical protein
MPARIEVETGRVDGVAVDAIQREARENFALLEAPELLSLRGS